MSQTSDIAFSVEGKSSFFYKYTLFSVFLLSRVKSAYAQVAHQAGAYSSFCIMKRLGAFLLHSGWDASPSQGYPQH